ncbi:YgfZ/GcvT domain-containing protein [Miltoncostaea marina]|uniref:CAF17-like 4Fe-4S cluster assembly/insertion protein YgfZ n=1 Tax=Miltoncostaea marina TaxID=2843215 RepID=UPI001C3DDDA9|nr:glycine cleavage T C-terminal barrel domain-containing protein [Miltoncostaea marina]
MSAPAAAPPDVAAGYARIRGDLPTAVRGRARLVWVEGPDAEGFLQGLLSADVARLAPGEGARALMLDAKGRIGADMAVHRDAGDAFTLVVAPALADGLAEALERYHFSEDLELLGPEEADTLTLAGLPAPPGGVATLIVPGLVPGTAEAVVDDPAAALAALARAGAEEAPGAALEMARIAAGAPRVGVDTGPATLVQEAALEDVAVSFDKGCYLGQETVARLQYRGRANRRLRGLLLPDPPPAAGAAVTLPGGREAGVLTSVAATPDLGPVGLAVLRREAAPGDEVAVAGSDRPARVVDLPFGRP